MLKFFKSKNPIIVLLYPVFAFVFIYLNRETVNINFLTDQKPFVYKNLIFLISGTYLKLNYIILSTFFLSLIGIFFNRLIQNLKIVNSFQNLHGFIFLFLVSFCLPFIDILQVSISLLFLFITIALIISSLRKDYAIFDYFNAGFALSAASFFWFQIIYFYPVILFGLIVFRNLNIREILSSIIGVFIPYFFIFSIWFFVNSDMDILYDFYQIIFNKNIYLNLNLNTIIPGIAFIVILLISTFHILKKYRSAESDKQDYYIFWFLIFLLALVYLIFFNKNSISYVIIILLSSSVPLGVFFAENNRPLVREIIFDLFLLAVIFSQFNFLQ